MNEREARCAKWVRRNTESLGVKPPKVKPVQPPELLRKIVVDHGEMTNKKFKGDKKLFIGGAECMPHALFKALENVPMPWEQGKMVDVVYHAKGALTIINDTPHDAEPLFFSQWAATWTALKEEKRTREHFERVSFPLFDDDEPIADYGTHLMNCEGEQPVISESLNEIQDAPIIDWFYDPVVAQRHSQGGPRGVILDPKRRQWHFNIPVMSNLYSHAEVLLTDSVERNYYYLFEQSAFATAKALGLTIVGGPTFRAPDGLTEDNDDWNEFNDLRKEIVRRPLKVDSVVAFPYLYSGHVDKDVRPTPYHYPVALHIREGEETIFDRVPAILNEVKQVKRADLLEAPPKLPPLKKANAGPGGKLQIPGGFKPIFADVPLEHDETRAALHLSWAPAPFNKLSGKLKRRTDVPLIDSWYHEHVASTNEVKSSYSRLLKESVKRQLKDGKSKTAKSDRKIQQQQEDEEEEEDFSGSPEQLDLQRSRVIDRLAGTKFFQKTRIEWLEASLQLLRQGHIMLRLLLAQRNLTYVHIDNNFNLKPTKTLTTKERKKSRLGQAFHLLRELLSLLKHVVDLHVKFRLGEVDGYQLADGMHYIFTHVAKLTGIYRYKYRVMRQVRRTRDLKYLVYSRFNTGDVPQGPGAGFWEPSWRVWVQYLRGLTPLLERYLGNMVSRLHEGRVAKAVAHKVTKQRIDSDYDVNLKADLKKTLLELLPEESRVSAVKPIEQHASEAWRCWKTNKEWTGGTLATPFVNIINRYVKEKADFYIKTTYYQRARIQKGDAIDKNLYMKNLGRMSRLGLRDEAHRQKSYKTNGPQLDPDTAVAVFQEVAQWLDSRTFNKMEFPQAGYHAEVQLLELALNRLRSQHNIANRLTQSEREEQKMIEEALDKPHETLGKIREILAKRRVFKDVDVEFMDSYSHLHPVYLITPEEKLADAFLEQYLWFESSQRALFPNWVKPHDHDIPPHLVYKWCQGINASPEIWETGQGESAAMMQAEFEDLTNNVDWTFFEPLLSLIMDPVLVEYIVARHNVWLQFKDMRHLHHIGLIRGFQFTSFLHQFSGVVVDLLLLGRRRAGQIAGPPTSPNNFLKWQISSLETAHPIRGYQRYYNRIHMLLRYTAAESTELITRYVEYQKEYVDPHFAVEKLMANFVNKPCWPRDCRMRIYKRDVLLANAISWEFSNRVPTAIATMSPESIFVSIYSNDNPNLLFDMCGFEVRLQPTSRAPNIGAAPDAENVWTIRDEVQDVQAKAHLQVTKEHVTKIRNRIRRGLMSIGNAAFERIAQKWNAVLTETIPYYREAMLGTEGLQQIFVEGEKKMQQKIMMALNSKMPKRFPPVLFYAPTDLGGLGMLSVAESLIPEGDKVVSKLTETGIQFFSKGLTHEDSDDPIPNLYRYYTPWESEFEESKRVWTEYARLSRTAQVAGRRLSYDEVEDIVHHGIPRISTAFSKERRLNAFEKFTIARQEYRKYQYGRPIKNWWYHDGIHGRLCAGLDAYRKDVIQALGGVEAILEHSMFQGTGFPSWEGFEFNRGTGFEDKKKDAKLTKAQRGNLSAVPNRRFVLWWSPTINRSNVYAGFETQIELTGVMMTGKLEMLKTTMIGIFAYHLWEKTHIGVVGDLLAALAQQEVKDSLNANDVLLEQGHPKKSFTFTNSSADIILEANNRWNVCKPKVIDANIVAGGADVVGGESPSDFLLSLATSKYWIDVQLRWGNYDSHNIAIYARSKFYDYTRDSVSRYPSVAGCVVAIDLAYNCWSAFGYFIPGVQKVISDMMKRIMRFNRAICQVREKMRQQLQLRSTEPTESNLGTQNYSDLFSDKTTWIIDDCNVFVTTEQKTEEGNTKFKSENGALIIVNPKTGALYLSIIHKSTFQGHKRRTALAKQKAAEEVAVWLTTVPLEERPQKIILTRKGAAQSMKHTLLEFPDIVIGKSDLTLPVSQVLKHDRIGDLVATARESRNIRFGLFDQWPAECQPLNCFSRLLLLLRATHVKPERTRTILEPNRSVERDAANFWPTLTLNDWKDVEYQLHEIIIADFAIRNKVDPKQITGKEAESIILGQEIRAEDIQQAEMQAVEEQTKTRLAQPVNAVSINKDGEKVHSRIKSSFEVTTTGGQKNDWKERALLASRYAALPPEVHSFGKSKSGKMVVLGTDLLKRMLWCADSQSSVAGILYGVDSGNSSTSAAAADSIVEVRCIALPPQVGNVNTINACTKVPIHESLAATEAGGGGLLPLGWIRCQAGQESSPTPTMSDLALHCKMLKDNDESYSPLCYHTILIAIGHGKCAINAITFTDEAIQEYTTGASNGGFSDAKANSPVSPEFYQSSAISLKKSVTGFFLVPNQGSWNYAFKGAVWAKEKYQSIVDTPKEFYHPSHRKSHFQPFEALLALDTNSRGAGSNEDGNFFEEVDEAF